VATPNSWNGISETTTNVSASEAMATAVTRITTYFRKSVNLSGRIKGAKLPNQNG
jgi:hypothetical protein